MGSFATSLNNKADASGSLVEECRDVIRIGFACNLEYRRGTLVSDDGWFVEEPFGVERTAVAVGLIHQLRNLTVS